MRLGSSTAFDLNRFSLLQPLGWRCVECAIHHERDVREEQPPYVVQYVWREQAMIE